MPEPSPLFLFNMSKKRPEVTHFHSRGAKTVKLKRIKRHAVAKSMRNAR